MAKHRLHVRVPHPKTTPEIEIALQVEIKPTPILTSTSSKQERYKAIDRLNHSIKAIEQAGLASESEFIRQVRDAGIAGKLDVGYSRTGHLRIRKPQTASTNEVNKLLMRTDRTPAGIKKQAAKAKKALDKVKPGAVKLDKALSQWSARDIDKIRKRMQLLEQAGVNMSTLGSDTIWDLATKLIDADTSRIKANMAYYLVHEEHAMVDSSNERLASILTAKTKEEAAAIAKLTDEQLKEAKVINKNLQSNWKDYNAAVREKRELKKATIAFQDPAMQASVMRKYLADFGGN